MGVKGHYNTIKTDILIIGGEGAGTRAAIEAATKNPSLSITLLTQGPIGRSALTSMANGGIHWVSHPHDSFKAHFQDIVRMRYYLNDQNLVEVLVTEAPLR
uniref:FAD-binding protein n=1 Tax=candidate division WOR-3 bacterium TaxID=2052148 RepID=A0A7C2P049_UNCW3